MTALDGYVMEGKPDCLVLVFICLLCLHEMADLSCCPSLTGVPSTGEEASAGPVQQGLESSAQ